MIEAPEPFLLVDKYRPQTVADCILPKAIKAKFQGYVDRQSFPNLILTGAPGCGKTTIARALGHQLGYEVLFLNASRDGNIDTLRTRMQAFASTVSLTGASLKMIILDEADHISQAAQAALRGFIEEFSGNCRFVLTANHRQKISDAIDSRAEDVAFKFPKAEMPTLMAEAMAKIGAILAAEGRTYDKAALAALIKKFFPNVRKVLNKIDGYAGPIDSGILADLKDGHLRTLFKALADKDFKAVRTWYVENNDVDTETMFRAIYDSASTYVNPKSIPELVLFTADYMHKSASVVDQEINMMAYFIELMRDIEFNG